MKILCDIPLIQLLSISVLVIVVAFSVGYSFGHRRSNTVSLNEELKAIEEMFITQGDSPEKVKAMMAVMQEQKRNKLKTEGREYLAIWLPSVLVVINIIVTITIELWKNKP